MPKITHYGDAGTPERHVRNEVIRTTVDGRQYSRVSYISPLHHYHSHRWITDDQFSAGEEMKRCYVIAFEGLHSCEYYERVDGGGKIPEMSDRQVDCLHKYQRGAASVGMDLPLIERVVILEDKLTEIEPNEWSRKKKLIELRRALNNLAKQYNII